MSERLTGIALSTRAGYGLRVIDLTFESIDGRSWALVAAGVIVGHDVSGCRSVK